MSSEHWKAQITGCYTGDTQAVGESLGNSSHVALPRWSMLPDCCSATGAGPSGSVSEVEDATQWPRFIDLGEEDWRDYIVSPQR